MYDSDNPVRNSTCAYALATSINDCLISKNRKLKYTQLLQIPVACGIS